MALYVQKFGGSSVSSVEQILDIARRITLLKREGHQVIAVVSAMGKTTDDLVSLAHQISPAPNRRELDMLLTTGERISMSLMSMALNEQKVSAISFTGSQAGVLTDGSHSNACIIEIRPIRVEEEIKKGNVVVLAGFQGVNPETKEVTTLGRGGSDTTAVAMAAHFRAERCDILKDVEGVFSADPKLVREAQHLHHLTYDHLLEMTFWGAKVLHYRCVELAQKLNVPLFIGLAHGNGRHTHIKKEIDVYEQTQVLAVNSFETIMPLHIFSTSQATALAQLNSLLERNRLPWPQILCSETNSDSTILHVTAPQETLGALRYLSNNEKWMQMGEQPYSSVSLTCHGAIASDLAQKVAAILTENKVVIHKIMQSSLSLTVLIEQRHRTTAVATLHRLIERS